MKVWIATDASWCNSFVRIYTLKPKYWDELIQQYEDDTNFYLCVCRGTLRRLLRGTGKRLPKHGTKEIVEIQLVAQ